TKTGKQESLSISFTNQSTISNPLILPKLQTTYKPSESGSYYSWGDKLNTPSNYDISDFFINGMNITNSLSLSSGNEKSQTYISIGNVDANGIIHNNNYNRYNFSVRNTTSLIKDK